MVHIEPFFVVNLSKAHLSESAFKKNSLSFLGVPESSEYSFAVSVG